MDSTHEMNQLIEILDTALTSDNPLVKDQLSKLLMVAALMSSTDKEVFHRPFASLFDEVSDLRNEVIRLKTDLRQLSDINQQINKYDSNRDNWGAAKASNWNDNDRWGPLLKSYSSRGGSEN